MKFKGITIPVCLRETYPTPRDDYLKYCERESAPLRAGRKSFAPASAYIYTRRCIFLPGTLLTIVTEREMERTTDRKGERERKRIEEGRGFIYRYGAV